MAKIEGDFKDIPEKKESIGCSGCLGLLCIVIMIIGFISGACHDEKNDGTATDTGENQPVVEQPETPPAEPEIATYNVTIDLEYQKTTLTTHPVCDLYIDGDRIDLAQADGTVKTVEIALEEGSHEAQIKSIDYGLVKGTASDKINFTVSEEGELIPIKYKMTLTGGLKLWNEQFGVTVE